MEWFKKLKELEMSNEVYDALKWVVITGLPALATLIIGLGKLYGFDPSTIAGTITLLAGFLGTCIGISSVKYAKKAKKDENAE